MEITQRLQAAFRPVQAKFLSSTGIVRMARRDIGREHYASYLRQVFHFTRENPQIQALATVYFRGHQRASIKRFFRHASSEIGHDQLARDDLETLGVDTSTLPLENPLPETSAFISFPFFQINNLNPVGYLGYLYFLEFLPTSSGQSVMDALEAAGIPRSAMTFLRDHAEIDVGHNKLMEGYIEALITNERELGSVIYAMRVTGILYARMLEAALAQADTPEDWGMSTAEADNQFGVHAAFEPELTGQRQRAPFGESVPMVSLRKIS